MSDAPHPWTLHDPGETGEPARITDALGFEVSPQRAWREVQVLRSDRDALIERLDAETERRIEAENPGIDMDRVRRERRPHTPIGGA